LGGPADWDAHHHRVWRSRGAAGRFNVFVRDVGQVFCVSCKYGLAYSVVYTSGTLSKRLSWLAVFNPMAPLVKLYQDAML
jgi:ABC-type polysaccharide/polyol phosphate export permease